MKNRIVYSLLVIFFVFVFVIFYRGLNNSNLYTPNTNIKIVPEFTSETLLKKNNIECLVTGRIKSSYSIWKKMQYKNLSMDQLSDIMAFRVIVDDVPRCYEALGFLHQEYTAIMGRFKDYISAPKRNGYQSLH